MTEQFLDKKEFISSESMQDSVPSITKKVWQPPKLTVMDYSETKADSSGGVDGPGLS
jgi:hypothetical protein